MFAELPSRSNKNKNEKKKEEERMITKTPQSKAEQSRAEQSRAKQTNEPQIENGKLTSAERERDSRRQVSFIQSAAESSLKTAPVVIDAETATTNHRSDSIVQSIASQSNRINPTHPTPPRLIQQYH